MATFGVPGEALLANERRSAGAINAKLFEQMDIERNKLVDQVGRLSLFNLWRHVFLT